MSQNEYISSLLHYLKNVIQCHAKLLDVENALNINKQKLNSLNSEKIETKSFKEPIKPKLEEPFDFLEAGLGLGIMQILTSLGIFFFTRNYYFPQRNFLFVLLGLGGIATIAGTVISGLINKPKIEAENSAKTDSYFEKVLNYRKSLVQEKNRVISAKKENALQKSLCTDRDNKLTQLQSILSNNLRLLYEQNILHPKYQNIPAIVAIYDYLSTGRTRSLEINGSDPGAYNIYEQGRLVRGAATFVSNTIVTTGSQIESSINNLSSSIRYQQQILYDANNKRYEAQLSLADTLNKLSDQQKQGNLLNQEILAQAKLGNELQSEGAYRILRNKSGYRINGW